MAYFVAVWRLFSPKPLILLNSQFNIIHIIGLLALTWRFFPLARAKPVNRNRQHLAPRQALLGLPSIAWTNPRAGMPLR